MAKKRGNTLVSIEKNHCYWYLHHFNFQLLFLVTSLDFGALLLVKILTMTLSEKDKIIIENYFLEKDWSAYKICQ